MSMNQSLIGEIPYGDSCYSYRIDKNKNGIITKIVKCPYFNFIDENKKLCSLLNISSDEEECLINKVKCCDFNLIDECSESIIANRMLQIMTDKIKK